MWGVFVMSSALEGKYLTHPEFRDLMCQVQFTVQRSGYYMWDVLWFHRSKGYFFGKDILMVPEQKASEFIMVDPFDE